MLSLSEECPDKYFTLALVNIFLNQSYNTTKSTALVTPWVKS